LRWSQLKVRVEQNLAASVRGRVQIFQTVYHRAPDNFGEIWVTLDGEQVFCWSDFASYFKEAEWGRRRERLSYPELHRLVERDQEDQSWYFRKQIERHLMRSLSLSIEAALRDRVSVVRGLAVLDRRCGKRRLPALMKSEAHPFVRAMLRVRYEAERMSYLLRRLRETE